MLVSLLFQFYLFTSVFVLNTCKCKGMPFTFNHLFLINLACMCCIMQKYPKKPSLCVFMCCSFLQEADIAVAPLTVTAKRETAVDMTKPFMQTGLSFILRKDLASDDSQFFSLLNMFSTEMWMGVLVAYLLTSICIFLVSR